MLEVTVDNFKYHRILLDNVTHGDTKVLKDNYDYSFVISYGDFNDNEYEIVEKKAAIIELSIGIDKLFYDFSSTCRKHIRRTKKIPEFNFTMEIDDFSLFYEFYKRCELERGWYPVPINELKNSIIFTCKYEGQYICGISAYIDDKKIRLGRIFTKRKSNMEIPTKYFSWGSRRIVYEFCQYGINRKYQLLDLGGIDLDDNRKSGIKDFKLSFGSKVVPVNIGRYIKPGSEAKKLQLEESGYDIT